MEDLGPGVGSISQVGWALGVSRLVGPVHGDRVECAVSEVEKGYNAHLVR